MPIAEADSVTFIPHVQILSLNPVVLSSKYMTTLPISFDTTAVSFDYDFVSVMLNLPSILSIAARGSAIKQTMPSLSQSIPQVPTSLRVEAMILTISLQAPLPLCFHFLILFPSLFRLVMLATLLFLRYLGYTLSSGTVQLLCALGWHVPLRHFHVFLIALGLCSDVPISVRPSLTTLIQIVYPTPDLSFFFCCSYLP